MQEIYSDVKQENIIISDSKDNPINENKKKSLPLILKDATAAINVLQKYIISFKCR